MRRTWFKKEMKQAILDGKKVSTTRDHPIPIGETQAVSGSRFKPEPFAILEIQDRIPTTVANVVRMFYEEEGFASSEEMVAYAKKNKLLQDENVPVWYHRFRIVKILSDLKEASPRKSRCEYCTVPVEVRRNTHCCERCTEENPMSEKPRKDEEKEALNVN